MTSRDLRRKRDELDSHLEADPERDLSDSPRIGLQDLPEMRNIADVGVHGLQLSVVQDVEELCAKFRRDPFSEKRGHLAQGHVQVETTGSRNSIAAQGPVATRNTALTKREIASGS